ncbi:MULTISPECIES: response regulator transcription factor [unclassified Sphingomonas]|uniref:response regulator transcription factor n=1 Tax=unclassified Sphingomonas TaxID=196159 RepID=UPI002151DD2F|nr:MULTISPECIES: response regulator transcription factor [unclassified Sphingomonas]MCR5869454.1 response regulator transcription factor [Sphingomonas sp. J344]UUX98815.1 response regulator transcription factor [Sphingomonas sp. J315]
MADCSRILLVEDDPALAREIVRALERHHWPVDHVASLGDAFEAVIQSPYRVILLDRRLPDGDGIGLIPAAKSRFSPPSIIFLTARDDLADRVEGLDAGADDYLVKPFALEELLARLRAASRRLPQADRPKPIEVAQLSYDAHTREVRARGRAVALPRRELALLELLVRRAGRVVQRAHLENEVYGFDVEVSANALEALVSRLRRRLEDEQAGVELRTVRGVGYILQPC